MSNNAPPTRTTPPPKPTHKLLHFIRSELFPSDHTSPSDDDDYNNDPDSSSDSPSSFASRRREKIYTFITIPKELEKLMGYGFFQCADAFLYVFTFLPLRSLIAVYTYVWGWMRSVSSGRGKVHLKPSDKCEIFKVGILLICSFLFTYIDTNVLYHVVKSQSVIKLYIFFNMLEVGDRLFGCFSQDTLDALFITATEHQSTTPPRSSSSPDSKPRAIKKLSTTTHAIICTFSILGHALVILFQSTTLSVAINANNRALLTVMMSNNFVELKGAVFKKFDKMNLFQVSCSDIRERFHLFILLLIVCLQTLREYSWEETRFWVLLPDCLMVLLAEIGVDWIKHAFITRFNELPLKVYEHYTRSLAYDMAESVKKKSNRFSSDHSDVVGRRLGFVPLPLAIVLIRVVSPMWRVDETRIVGIVALSLCGYVGLASFRVLNMVVLVGKAVRIIDEHNRRGGGEEEPAPISSPVKNSILKRTRTISGSDGDLYVSMMKEASKSDKKLKFEDEIDRSDGMVGKEGLTKIHLLANSNVSLVSVGFNEEMMKVEEGMKGVDCVRIGERKHSLGSNLDDSVLMMRGVVNTEECGGGGDVGVEQKEGENGVEWKVKEEDNESVMMKDDDLLDRTVIKVEVVDGEVSSDHVYEKADSKLLDIPVMEQLHIKQEVDSLVEDSVCTSSSSTEGGESSQLASTSKKKKLISWFK